ncbi:Dak1-domain-containing protein [Lophium mytilinum]|uniref:Dak1-domain-containing protein n=1 Tax=Lophium mytilinum TaxID=390894 RepID=A0A6A6QKH4_9PEZI|nr:Dak1-domain-containing protein [Lophium mytilinum]
MSLGKHFINDVTNPVERALRSMLLHDTALRLIESEKGGAGHEPAHAGFLGEGMLDICVSGNTFASPSASQVFAGVKSLPSPQGTLMIVKNYTGDKLNFGLAAEKAKAIGKRVNVVFVGDDVAVEGNGLVGRRGLAGVAFVHKVAGALASSGADLDSTTAIAQKVADQMATVGVSLDRCSVPRRGEQEPLPFDQLEYGMGIHNEPGVRRARIPSLSETVTRVLQMLTKKRSISWTPTTTQCLAVMVNNLGGLSVLELNVVTQEVVRQLRKDGLQIRRLLMGTFVSSLNGPGFSVTLLEVDPQIEMLLDAPTTAPAWPKIISPISISAADDQIIHEADTEAVPVSEGTPLLPVSSALITTIIQSIVSSVFTSEPLITHYDTIAGDGDCGETLLNGANALLTEFSNPTSPTLSLPTVFHTIATVIERSMGGTSGAIYAIFLNAVSTALAKTSTSTDFRKTAPPSPPMSPSTGPQSQLSYSIIIASAFRSGLTELCKYTSARKGHRTLMDALIPFVDVFEESGDLIRAGNAAREGAEGTRSMKALLGRASYVGESAFEGEKGGIPDPGALGVVSVVDGVCKGLATES